MKLPHSNKINQFIYLSIYLSNVNLKIDANNMNIPIIFHNLRGYDSHFIMQNISQIPKKHAYKWYTK